MCFPGDSDVRITRRHRGFAYVSPSETLFHRRVGLLLGPAACGRSAWRDREIWMQSEPRRPQIIHGDTPPKAKQREECPHTRPRGEECAAMVQGTRRPQAGRRRFLHADRPDLHVDPERLSAFSPRPAMCLGRLSLSRPSPRRRRPSAWPCPVRRTAPWEG